MMITLSSSHGGHSYECINRGCLASNCINSTYVWLIQEIDECLEEELLQLSARGLEMALVKGSNKQAEVPAKRVEGDDLLNPSGRQTDLLYKTDLQQEILPCLA
uniref:Uncharacterized protein n=1 Tax=Sphaerodactylus townsendi TaxID=933632 RepID=A0ACB8FD61_9SAUR